MTLVSTSQFELMKARKELEQAFSNGDWQSLRSWDLTLGNRLSDAFEDEERDATSLIREMERILACYRLIMSQLPECAHQAVKPTRS